MRQHSDQCAVVVAETEGHWPANGAPSLVVLGWLGCDPHTVSMHFPGANCTWIFGRELLAEGLYVPAGIGDVRIAPVPDVGDLGLIQVELSSPNGYAEFVLSGDDVADFLTETTKRIPIGGEPLKSIDDAIADLLGQDIGGL